MKIHIRNVLLTSLFFLSTSLRAEPLAGLWLGIVKVDKVNEVYKDLSGYAEANTTTPQAVKYPFNLQFIFHTDASGKTKLLKEVYVMQTKNTNKTHRVLVTEEERLSDFDGIVRLTSPSIDFNSTINFLELTGKLEHGSSVSVTNILHAKSNPTNPFMHQFHPDHKVGRDVNRSFIITLNEKNEALESGKTRLSGRYEETLTGLHKAKLKVSGDIVLTLVSNIAVLNPSVKGDK